MRLVTRPDLLQDVLPAIRDLACEGVLEPREVRRQAQTAVAEIVAALQRNG
jgi:hypothetical protein